MLVFGVPDLAAGVRDRGLELASDVVGRVEDVDRPLLGTARRRHLLLGLLEVHDLRADLREDAAREREGLAVARVEAFRDVASQLHVLALVGPDRDDVGLIQEDVSRLQHRVGEEAGGHELLRLRLLLELRHPAQLAEARDR